MIVNYSTSKRYSYVHNLALYDMSYSIPAYPFVEGCRDGVTSPFDDVLVSHALNVCCAITICGRIVVGHTDVLSGEVTHFFKKFLPLFE